MRRLDPTSGSVAKRHLLQCFQEQTAEPYPKPESTPATQTTSEWAKAALHFHADP